MKILKMNTLKSYDIILENGSLNKVEKYILGRNILKKVKKILIISDDNVSKIYMNNITASLKRINLQIVTFIFKHGENQKNLSTVNEIYKTLIENSFSRTDLIIALGGGVTGDISGFAAATYQRGIKYIQLPTSLLSQIDSSVGGKTGVNISDGKNMVGSFWQPSLVIIDPNTLKTLPQKYFSDGMAEAIKYGCIKDKSLFFKLLDGVNDNNIEDIIYSCINIKKEVVENDEFDNSERMILNFGHTIGHALEKIHNFNSLSHGEAVGIGMLMITKASENLGLTKKGSVKLILDALKKYNLPISDSSPINKISHIASNDKKSVENDINLVLLKEIGNGFIYKIQKADLYDFILKGSN